MGKQILPFKNTSVYRILDVMEKRTAGGAGFGFPGSGSGIRGPVSGI
jgi:hypothetical protein